MIVDIIAGARPNFMKIAPIIEAIHQAQQQGIAIQYRLIHTGQHYDSKLSDTFFEQLGIPTPHVNLESGSGTQAQQTGNIMVRFEEDLLKHPCDVVLVVGDVNSTLACSIVAKKLHVQVVHVEAGIRSRDLTMPEEINRMVTDAITDQFFTTSEYANENLRKEGISEHRIHFVGNTMIDTLLKNIPKLRKPDFFDEKALTEKQYLVLTLHRPANVDEPAKLQALLEELIAHTGDYALVFPVHPRTRKALNTIELSRPEKLVLTEPLGYHEFIWLVKNSFAVVTDSGGVQEETTVLGVPCVTLRDNTERFETVSIGTNELIGTNPNAIRPNMEKLFSGNWKNGAVPPLWDGRTAERIVAKLWELYGDEKI
ncbi:MAG: UDP-N-acetylglucosamine 2-epimerase (non-hydrolyzing) [Spirosomataceae bacterium]